MAKTLLTDIDRGISKEQRGTSEIKTPVSADHNRLPVKHDPYGVPPKQLPQEVKAKLKPGYRLLVHSYYEEDPETGKYRGFNSYSIYDEEDYLVFDFQEETLDQLEKKKETLDQLEKKDARGIGDRGLPPPPAPRISLSAEPTSVKYGGRTRLRWFSTNSNKCTASGEWSGRRKRRGSTWVGPLNKTSTFTLTCIGAGGEVSRSVTVKVLPPPTPIPSDGETDRSKVIPKPDRDWGTLVSLVGTILDAIGLFAGSIVAGFLAVLFSFAGAAFAMSAAGKAGSATRRMAELLARGFAVTAWTFNHKSPKIPEKLVSNAKGRAWTDVKEGWKCVKDQEAILNKWFDDKIYPKVIIEARKKNLPVPTKNQVREAISKNINISPQKFAKEILISKEITSHLLPGEKNAKPSMWYDYYAKFQYKKAE